MSVCYLEVGEEVVFKLWRNIDVEWLIHSSTLLPHIIAINVKDKCLQVLQLLSCGGGHMVDGVAARQYIHCN